MCLIQRIKTILQENQEIVDADIGDKTLRLSRIVHQKSDDVDHFEWALCHWEEIVGRFDLSVKVTGNEMLVGFTYDVSSRKNTYKAEMIERLYRIDELSKLASYAKMNFSKGAGPRKDSFICDPDLLLSDSSAFLESLGFHKRKYGKHIPFEIYPVAMKEGEWVINRYLHTFEIFGDFKRHITRVPALKIHHRWILKWENGDEKRTSELLSITKPDSHGGGYHFYINDGVKYRIPLTKSVEVTHHQDIVDMGFSMVSNHILDIYETQFPGRVSYRCGDDWIYVLGTGVQTYVFKGDEVKHFIHFDDLKTYVTKNQECVISNARRP